MGLPLDFLPIVLPIIVVGGIALFIILRMKHKYEKGTLGKKKTKSAQNFLDSLIPLGMMIGLAVATLLSIFTSFSLLAATAWGPGIGMLVGYIAYEVYSKKEEVDP
ncbi:hypothetical protein [Lentibacillus saliphilus]|uniref:hypothetical protein n=1 Tax=Lentibacillus saliphilus TaxID=2737028 RepID=UPI001C308D77|nr:hypothetical protein [Lentibacillus saliphilus]